MKLRCTVLCLVMLVAALVQQRGDAQGPYGPYQPGQPVAAAPGPGGAAMMPAWQQMPGAPMPGAMPGGPMPGFMPGGPMPGAMPGGAMPPYGGSGPPAGMPVSWYGDAAESYPPPGVGGGETIMGGDYCDTCGDAACSCPGKRFWFDGEYLVWWREGRRLPPLVTTSPAGTDQDLAGVLPDAQILFGNERVSDNPGTGMRMEVGMWLDDCETWGLGVSGYSLNDNAVDFGASSNGVPTIALPFYNVLLPGNDAQLVAYTNPTGQRLVRGNVSIHTANNVAGGDVFLRKRVNGAVFSDYALFMMQGPAWIYSCFQAIGFPSMDAFGHTAYSCKQPIARMDLLGGYQTARITDYLDSRFHLTSLNNSFLDPVGTRIDVVDQFNAYNEFHGGMLGMMLTAERGCWSMEFTGKVGIGNMHQNVTNRGVTVVTLPPPFQFLSDRRNRGFLTQPSVTGSFSEDRFTVVPEAKIKLRRQLTCNFDVYMSYSFIYWNNVALGGDQASLAINPFELDNTPNNFSIQSSSFFVQGIGFGARYQY